MNDHAPSSARAASTTEGLAIAPSLGPTLERDSAPRRIASLDRRAVFISGLSILVAFGAAMIAQVLTRLIGFITNVAFYGRISGDMVSPAHHKLGAFVIVLPALGGIVVGFMARYGSKAIRGHGIPEAMEQVLLNESRIPARMTFLKPISSAIAIGTGGPFGAEGPIIATGGALGSVVGQFIKITADERKTLLAAGAAAGMAATFGSPVSAVLLAIELLLFEYKPRSIIPVALAASMANAVRIATVGNEPAFAMTNVLQPGGAALATYIVLGGIVGVASVLVTRAVYAIEDAFEKLPIHWMWWPALGGLAVGIAGFFAPRSLGVGYDNIDALVAGSMTTGAIAVLCAFKFFSWSISLGSGTSGGTLAPLFTFGGGIGAVLGAAVIAVGPSLGVDVRVAALVGMAAMFAGASRALLASVVFAFETTRQPLGLLPLLGGCSAAFLVSSLLMRHSIMTEKIARRGTSVLGEYSADYLQQILVRSCCSEQVISLRAEDAVDLVRSWFEDGVEGSSHQGFPVLDAGAELVGVVTRREVMREPKGTHRVLKDLIRRPPVVVFDDDSARQAADHMVREKIGRLPVVRRSNPKQVIGMITRSDLLTAHEPRLAREQHAKVLRPIPLGSKLGEIRRRFGSESSIE